MPLTLYYVAPSPPARSVDLVIHTLGLTAEYKNIELTEKQQYTPEFLQMNPLHTVPVIDDDGFILWESRAIMTYLVSKYAADDSLYPKDIRMRAIVDQRLHYSNDVFYLARDIAKGLIYNNADGITEEQLRKVKGTQENIEKLLQDQTFMAGENLTVADYSFVTIVDVLEIYNPSGEAHPLTKAWVERCKSSIKDFENVSKPGGDLLRDMIEEKLGKRPE